MSLRFEEETNVYNNCGNFLGHVAEPVKDCYPNFIALDNAEFNPDDLREIADYLESL